MRVAQPKGKSTRRQLKSATPRAKPPGSSEKKAEEEAASPQPEERSSLTQSVVAIPTGIEVPREIPRPMTAGTIAHIPKDYEELCEYLDATAQAESAAMDRCMHQDSFDPGETPEDVLAKIRAKLASQKAEIEGLNSVVSSLKSELAAERTAREEMAKDDATRLEKQKAEFETALERQLNFIGQLVKDKQEMTELCEQVKARAKVEEAKWAKKLTELDKKQKHEMKRNKEAWTAAEKLRREKWEKEKLQDIKQMTTKALEPQLAAMVQNYKQQLQELETSLTAKHREEKARMSADYEARLDELKAQVRSSMEQAVQRERTAGEGRVESQCEDIRKLYEEQRARMAGEYKKEVDRIEALKIQEREKYDKELYELRAETEAKLDTMRLFYETQMEELRNQHKAELEKAKLPSPAS